MVNVHVLRLFAIMKVNNWVDLFVVAFLVLAQNANAQSWTQKTDFINGESSGAYAFTIDDTIYVGNTGGTGFYKYDHTTDTWTSKAQVPSALYDRTNATGFAVNGKGYMLGGINSSGVCMADVWEYSPATDTWAQKADFPGGKRGSASCFVIGSKAYVGGGYDTIDITGFSLTPKNDLWQYDPATDTWTSKAAIPYDSSYLLQPFSFSIGSKGYFSCGDRVRLSANVYHDTDVNTTYEYDTATNTWTQKANFPGPIRSGGISFVLNNIAYCATGIDDTSNTITGTCYNDLYAYDAAMNTWTSLPIAPFGARTYAIAATVSTGAAYAGTGWHSPSTTVYYKDWWEFAPSTSTGIHEVGSAGMHITCFPNPNKGMFLIMLSSGIDEAVQLNISNMVGEKVRELEATTNSILEIQLNVPAGLYLVTAATTHGRYTDKIMVE